MKLTPWRKNDVTAPAQNLATWIQRFFDDPWFTTTPFATTQLAGNLPEAFTRTGLPPVNIAESDKELTVTVELPGLKEEDINVSFAGNQLTIQAERKFEDEKKDKHYHRVECQYGTLTRTLTLPEGVKRDAVDARYKNGILTLTIPKVEPTPTTKVKVKGG